MNPLETRSAEALAPGQWRLARIELVNWGTFHGHTRIDIARRGHLFTGPSGSGKSSLLDAIATALTPQNMIRYNAAAQDNSSRADDRSLVSYVRGAWAKQADEFEDRAVSAYLRTGAVWSGILLRFENADDAPVTLVRLFHLRAGSTERSDVKDVGFVDRTDAELLDFEPFISSGVDARSLKRAWPNAVVTTSGGHKPYFARLVRLLGIGGEHGLQLLHRTQSAKNLGSLDRLFRDFMLDTPATFDRAKSAVAQFGDLNEAHRMVVRAREQVDHLRAMEPPMSAYETSLRAGDDARRLLGLIETYQARLARRLAEDELVQVRIDRAEADDRRRTADTMFSLADEALRRAERQTGEVGGDAVERSRERLDEAHAAATRVETAWERLVSALGSVGVDLPTDAASFAALRAAAERELAEAAAPPKLHEHEDQKAYFTAKADVSRLDAEIGELARRRSNLPGRLLAVRHALARELGVSENALPFAGELMEVRPAFEEWTGAIERVLRPFATALLVRTEHLRSLRRLVEGRHLGVRLVFEEVPAVFESPRPLRSSRSLLHRVEVTPGPFHDWLHSRLSTQFDYDCVESPDELDTVERGVTIRGQVKISARRYEKNDAFAVDDRETWVLGGDNERKLAELRARRDAARASLAVAERGLAAAQAAQSEAIRRREVLTLVLRQEWHELDRRAAVGMVERRQRELHALTEGNARLEDALEREQAARQGYEAAQAEVTSTAAGLQRLEAQEAEVRAAIERADEKLRAAPALDDEDVAALDSRYQTVQRRITRSNAAEIEAKVSRALGDEERLAMTAVGRARSAFEAAAHDFRVQFREVGADVTDSIDDRAAYRSLRERIETRGLPEYETRFLELLREKSRDAVGLLLNELRDAPKAVRDRIDPVNLSLRRSPFDVGRTLRIRVKEQRSSEVLEFLADLRRVVDHSWDEDDVETAEERFAILHRVMTRLGSSDRDDLQWQRRCLDTREHVTFQAQEVDGSGQVVAVHDSSAGLSGGQRQKLVVFCLAAALRYQLTEDEAELPAYGSIVLDEAFDKADSAYTRMALDIFREFGFHLLLATPQKLLSTIEPYVGAVTAITNQTRQQSLVADVRWDTSSAGDTERAGESATSKDGAA